MKTIIYQQADDFLKQPAVTLQFPDAIPEDEGQSMECEKIREEIHSILQHAVPGLEETYEKSSHTVTSQF
ncbi:MAG: hypothetical protein HDR30_06855 [Lachnospiraceae bacterium]|nr:hypothetical protein [Lachnospiraceae bacterium]